MLIRADLNVPMTDGAVADSARIDACAPTIREMVDHGGKPVIISHLGRPTAYGIVYLASDEAKFVTGSDLVIDGGYTAR